MNIDLKHVADYLFTGDKRYKELSNKDKETFFFILNRKIARKFPRRAKFLNEKTFDKSSSLDIWYYFFMKKRSIDIPKWYYYKLSGKGKKNNSSLKTEEIEYFKKLYNIKDQDIEFLEKYYPDELKTEVKKFKKFKKK